MKFKDLKVGEIFSCPDMPQWGLMLKSYLKQDKKIIIVSLTGNRWSHYPFTGLDDEMEVLIEDSISKIIHRLRR